MRIVSYADEHFRTTDAVADAVLRYSMLLAQGSSSDVVRIPVIRDQDQTWAQIIVGPASQITTLEVAVDDDDATLDDAATVADLSRRADELATAQAPRSAQTEPADEADPFDLDYLD